MISELAIIGYKALEDLRLDNLKRVTLIGGKNNVGKSSVLEAIFVAFNWGNPEALTTHLRWRGVDAFQVDSQAWAASFTDFKDLARFEVRMKNYEGGRDAFVAQVQQGGAPVHSQQSTVGGVNTAIPNTESLRVSFTRSSKTIFDATVHMTGALPPYSFRNFRATEKPPQTHFSLARSRSNALDDAMRYGALDRENNVDELISALQIIEPRLKSLSVIPVGPHPILHASVDGINRKVPVNLLGDGVNRLLSLLLHISGVKGGYVLVDEVENGFHHSTLEDVWRVLYDAAKTWNCQLFATTHSYECLAAYSGALEPLAPNDYSYVRMQRTESEVIGDGAVKSHKITATQYPSDVLRDAIAGAWEVR